MRRIRILGAALLPLLSGACSGPADPGAGAPADAPRTILVTGATGTQGGAVARELLVRGYSVRALTRDPSKPAAQSLAGRGAEVVRGDFDDAESLAAAMAGVHGVFAVTDFWEHGKDVEIAHGRALILAAERSGVEHFVYTSVAGADQDTGLAHFDSKHEIERMLADSGLDYTVVRPVEFMDNWRYGLEQLRAGRYVNPREPTDRHQWIAASDIGFFVAEAFDHPADWVGRTQAIAGDELSLRELVAVMSDVFGRPVEHVQVSWEEFEQGAGKELTDMYRWFAGAGYDVDIAALRGEYPHLVTVRAYLEGLAAGGGPN